MTAAMNQATGRQDCAALLRSATDPKFGDYQANGVMALAKQVKVNPRDLAQKVVDCLKWEEICEPPEIAGPGFINLRLKTDFIVDTLLKINAKHECLGIDTTNNPKKIVVDFSSPNIAKEMHVGHLRSTIIGDAICRMLEFEGHTVKRQNHIGDWGRQFGRVILGLWHMCMAKQHIKEDQLDSTVYYYQSELRELEESAQDKSTLEAICKRIRDRHKEDWEKDSEGKDNPSSGEKFFHPFLDDLQNRNPRELWPDFLAAYQYVNRLEDSLTDMGMDIPIRMRDPQKDTWIIKSIPYESLSRHITTMLQNIDHPDNEQEKKAWQRITDISLDHCREVYDLLNVKITDEHFDYEVVRGESYYRKMLPAVVNDLKKMGLAVESDGAMCVFPAGFKNKEGNPLPLIIQKSDGAHLYATTDLAAVRFRVDQLEAKRIVYVTGAPQALHFEMFFAVARQAGWANDDVDLVHVTFGSVLGEDGRPLKTRSGENIKLRDLLEEAVQKARSVVEEKNPDLDDQTKQDIARAVGIGAVKYADYSTNRNSDYIFSFDRMLSLEGNTAPYMQYAYARVKSIEQKAEDKHVNIEAELADMKQLTLDDPAELDLARYLIRYGEAIESASQDCRPNYLTQYLYDLAQKFSAFYNACPVLDAGPDKRPTRLLLCDLTARTIRHGLTDLLGIEVVEQM
ncbi:MAG: arginine--tRNA ligase [Sedimentisphaerales bacterium]|nr:arginine--tRNA ligase [Sedimentisphaerales bacterium]